MDMYRVTGGMIVEAWHVEDVATLIAQVGGPTERLSVSRQRLDTLVQRAARLPATIDLYRRLPVTDLEVPLVSWPRQAELRADLAGAGRARLLVVDEHYDPPPAHDPLEDWVRVGADTVEVYTRRERLRRDQARRAPAVFDGDGLLRRGRRWVAVSPRERQLLEPLLARVGAPVSRVELLAAVLPGAVADEHRALDRLVRRVRARVAPLAMNVLVVRGFGYLLALEALPD
jgi:hypothetical protein